MAEEMLSLNNPLMRPRTHDRKHTLVEKSTNETMNRWPKGRPGLAIDRRDQGAFVEEKLGLIYPLKRSRTHGQRDARVQQIRPILNG